MIYRFSDLIPANTVKANTRSKKIMLPAGKIVLVDPSFPPGCHELAHMSVWKGGHQVFPTNPEDDFHEDGPTPPFREDYSVKEGDVWYLKTWNEDDTYDHKVTLRLNVLHPEAASPWETLRDFVAIMKRIMGL